MIVANSWSLGVGSQLPVQQDPILAKLGSSKSCCCIKRKTEQSERLAQIILNQSWHKSWDDVRKQLITSFSSAEFSKLSRELRLILRGLDSKQQNELLNEVALKSIQDNIPDLINRCLELFTSDEMLKMNHTQEFLEKKIAFMARCEELQNEKNYTAPSYTGAKYYLCSVVKFLHSLLDTLLTAFSFFEIGREPGSSWEASHMLQVYGQLFSIPLLLMTFFTGILASPATAALTTVGVIAAIVIILVVYVKYLKPSPEYLRDSANLSSAARRGEIEPTIGCEKDVYKCFQYLARGQRPVFVGRSGIGKTTRTGALALMSLTNDPNVPKKFRKMTFRYFNAADIVRNGVSLERQDPLNQLKTHVERNGKNEVIIIDEAHTFVMPQYKAKYGTQFNTLLDNLPHSIPNVVLCTTDEGWDKYIMATDLKRRMKKISVIESSDETILQVLEAMATRIAPEMEISKEVLQAVINSSQKYMKDQIKLNASKETLAAVVNAIREAEEVTELEKKLIDAKARESVICNRERIADPSSIGEVQIKEQRAVQNEVEKLDKDREAEINKIEELRKLKEKKIQFNLKLYAWAKQIQKGGSVEHLKKQFLFALDHLVPTMKSQIEQQRKDLKLSILTADFVKEYVAKEAMNVPQVNNVIGQRNELAAHGQE